MIRIKSLCLLFLLLMLSLSTYAQQARSPKVLLLYADVGNGHKSTARAIEMQIKERDPNAEVELVNFRAFLPEWKKRFGSWSFFFFLRHFPHIFTFGYESLMLSGRLAPHIVHNPMPAERYSHRRVMEMINEKNPDVIISTFQFAADALAQLRYRGLLQDKKVGWLQTDYYEGYLPRTSVYLDRSFLPHQTLVDLWRIRGVPETQVVNSGMPLNPSIYASENRDEVFTREGLDPSKKTLVILGGGDGSLPFERIIDEVSRHVTDNIQIIAVTGRNEVAKERLEILKNNLPNHVDLRPEGFVLHDRLLPIIKTCDVYMTKPGGISPTEGAVMNVPMILMDTAGHESVNAGLFEGLRMALVNRNLSEVGPQVKRLFTDSELVADMRQEQVRFRNSMEIDAFIDFIYDENVPRAKGFNLKMRRGETRIMEAFSEDLRRFEVEVYLTYPNPRRFINADQMLNPIQNQGTFALRVGNTVFKIDRNAAGELMLVSEAMGAFLQEHPQSHSKLAMRVGGYTSDELEQIKSNLNRSFMRSHLSTDIQLLQRAFGEEFESTGKIDIFEELISKMQNHPERSIELVQLRPDRSGRHTFKVSNYPVTFLKIKQAGRQLFSNLVSLSKRAAHKARCALSFSIFR